MVTREDVLDILDGAGRATVFLAAGARAWNPDGLGPIEGPATVTYRRFHVDGEWTVDVA